jgi:hypothetical protein
LLFATGLFVGVVLRNVLLGVLLFALGAILFAIRGYLNTGDKAVAGAPAKASAAVASVAAVTEWMSGLSIRK